MKLQEGYYMADYGKSTEYFLYQNGEVVKLSESSGRLSTAGIIQNKDGVAELQSTRSEVQSTSEGEFKHLTESELLQRQNGAAIQDKLEAAFNSLVP